MRPVKRFGPLIRHDWDNTWHDLPDERIDSNQIICGCVTDILFETEPKRAYSLVFYTKKANADSVKVCFKRGESRWLYDETSLYGYRWFIPEFETSGRTLCMSLVCWLNEYDKEELTFWMNMEEVPTIGEMRND